MSQATCKEWKQHITEQLTKVCEQIIDNGCKYSDITFYSALEIRSMLRDCHISALFSCVRNMVRDFEKEHLGRSC